MFYWIKLKDGRLQTQQSKPKGRPHLSEETHEVRGDFQHYVHKFTMYDSKDNNKGTCDLNTYCGYDRGPGLQHTVTKLLLGLR